MPTILDFIMIANYIVTYTVNNNFHTSEIVIKADSDDKAPKEILEYLRTAYHHRKEEIALIRFWKISSI